MVDKEIFADIAPHIVRQFQQFHRENPNVWSTLIRFTKQVKAAGRSRYGIAAIFERVRWHIAIETKGDDFKLNNNHKACYARLLTATYPEFDGLFQLRSRQS